jgi:hypothetical protein
MESVGAILPPGAGRFQDFYWPDPLNAHVGASGASRGRDASSTAGFGGVVLINGGAASLTAVINGVPCQQLLSTAPNLGSQRFFYPGFIMMLRTSRSLISQAVDDTMVYRFVVNMAGGGIAVAAGRDFGFELVRFNGAAVATRIAADAAPGIGLRLQDANVVQLLINGPNGTIVTNLTAGPFDVTAFHTYDLRIFNATANTDAFLTLRIDGALQALSAINSNWGAIGTNLPPIALNGSFAGFVPTLVTDSQNNNGFFVQQCHMICAPNELMTL